MHRSYHFFDMSTFAARLFSLFALLCLATACDSEPAKKRPPPPDSPSTACPNERELGEDESARRGVLHGDVSGDGRRDEVFLAVDEGAERGCRALLFVADQGKRSAASLDVEETDLSLGLPAISGLKQIDGLDGAEIVVDMAAGASTFFAGVFVFVDGSLEQVRIDQSQPPTENLFAYGGGVGQLSAADCAADGAIVISTAVPEGRRYRVDRHSYTFDGIVIARDPSKDETHRRRLGTIPRSFPEFAGPPFSSCPDA